MGLDASPHSGPDAMRRSMRFVVPLLFALAPATRAQRAVPVPTPASVLGFVPGADRHLVEWDTIVRYFRVLDRASTRVTRSEERRVGKECRL